MYLLRVFQVLLSERFFVDAKSGFTDRLAEPRRTGHSGSAFVGNRQLDQFIHFDGGVTVGDATTGCAQVPAGVKAGTFGILQAVPAVLAERVGKLFVESVTSDQLRRVWHVANGRGLAVTLIGDP